MVRVAIISKGSPDARAIAGKIKQLLQKRQVKFSSSPELVFVVGGDGSVLFAEHKYPGVPKVCFSRGRINFLSETVPQNLEQAIKQVLAGRYTIEQRVKLSHNTRLPYALNEIALLSGEPGRIVGIDIWIDGEAADTIYADGIIFSTPTGSTAHALSAGGPVVLPTAGVIDIVPISPFKLASRPIIVPDNVILTAKSHAKALLSVDGQISCKVKAGEAIVIRKAKVGAQLIRLAPENFFRKLRILP